MSINHQQMGYSGQQPTPQIFFELTNNEQYVNNYLIAPGNTCYFLDTANKKFYEKTYDSLTTYDLENPHTTSRFGSQPVQNQGLTKEEVAQMIAEALSQYNPHIPKKERKANE